MQKMRKIKKKLKIMVDIRDKLCYYNHVSEFVTFL